MLNQANKAVLDALVALHANMLAQDLGNQAERPTEEEFQACMAAASAAIRAATEEGAPAPADPMDWPLPCDVVIGHITMRKGLKLSALVKPMQVLYEMTEGASLAAQAELAVAALSDDMVLAAARVLSPNLFRHGLHPLPKDGKYTAMMMRVEAERARAMLTAALAAAPQPQAPAAQGDALTQAARDVLAERQRQIGAEGWKPERDDQYLLGELALAGAAYAMQSIDADDEDRGVIMAPQWWPWAQRWWKPTSRRRMLEKSGALILAELERLDRAAIAAQKGRAA